MSALQFPSPHLILYEYPPLRISILGGISIHHFDRLRVTVKIEVTARKHAAYLEHPELAEMALRQNLDLYNDHQTEKFIRKASERLETGSLPIIQAFAELTELLEAYRLEQWQASQNTEQKGYNMSTDEKAAALQFLQSPQLMQRTNELIGFSGVVGEQINRLLMYIVFTSRKTATPLHVISLAASGTGKTHLQEQVGQLIPDEDKIEITSLSEQALYYFDKTALSHKLLLIEDLDGAQSALFPIRELQSKRKISKTISYKDSKGNTRSQQLIVEGPVCVAGCTTKESIYEDNANRSFLLYLDESKGQDEAIMEYQRLQSAGRIDKTVQQEAKILLQNCQRLLQPVTVINPYAPQLKIPEEVLKSRRTNRHYLDFIAAVTFYHQYQRQWFNPDTGESLPVGEVGGVIETTPEDIAAANELMKTVLLRKTDMLSGAVRNYLETLRQWTAANEAVFTSRTMMQALRIPHSTVKRYHKELAEAGIIQRTTDKGKTYQYHITDPVTYQQMQQQVDTVLDTILQQITVSKKQSTSSKKLSK